MSRAGTIRQTMKYAAIRLGLETVALSRAKSVMPSLAGRGLIFTLHHVRPGSQKTFQPNAILSVTPEFLEQAIVVAKSHDLVPVPLHDLPDLLADPADTRRFVAFTLDDGYRNNAEFAAPVFRRHGVPYTIFVTPGFVERSRSIWWETAEALVGQTENLTFDFAGHPEVVPSVTRGEKMAAFDRFARFVRTIDEDEAVSRIDEAAAAHGIEPLAIVETLVMNRAELHDLTHGDPLAHLGAHTMTHVNLKRVGDERLEHEIGESKRIVAAYSGSTPRSFSYPYGWQTATGEREAAAVSRAGFSAAVTTQPGVLQTESAEGRCALPRVSLNGRYQKPRYVEALISGIPFKLMK